MAKPLVVIVSGAPGSGKTVLASKLAEHLRLPLLERDTILRGMEYTRGPFDKAKIGIPLYYAQLKHMIDAGISFVANDTLYKNVSEKALRMAVLPYSVAVNIHAKQEGGAVSELKNSQQKKLYQSTLEPLDVGIPVVEVAVSSEFTPQISEVAVRIRELYTGEPQDLWKSVAGEENK